MPNCSFKENICPVKSGFEYKSKGDRNLRTVESSICSEILWLITIFWYLIHFPFNLFSWQDWNHHIKNFLLVLLAWWGKKANCSGDSCSAWSASSDFNPLFFLLPASFYTICQRRKFCFIIPPFREYLARIFSFFLPPSHWNSWSD